MVKLLVTIINSIVLSTMLRFLPLFLFIFLFNTSGSAQTVIDVDLTASPNITKTYTGYPRSGNNCNDSDCIIFNITLNPGSDLVSFNASQNTGASFYTINCGTLTPVGTPACISGETQVSLSFCKPGGNTNIVYTITASTAVSASADLTVRAGCSAPLSVVGVDPTTVTWTSVYPGAEGAYNSFLSCTSGCTTTTFTATPTAPAYIDYKVSGTVSSCPNLRSDIVRVYVVPGMQVAFNPGNTVICSGTATTLSTTVTGGNPPYNYSWTRDGAPLSNTTSSISTTDVGTYVVTVSDNTNCAAVPQSIVVSAAATPPEPTAIGSTICSGNSTTLSATDPGGTYQWYDAAAGGNLLSSNATYTTPVLTSSKTYYVQTTVNGCTSPRTAVNVIVNPIPPAPTAAGITICSGNVGVLNATAPGGNYEWYNATSGGIPLGSGNSFTTPALTTTTIYYVQTTVNGCTSARTAVTVTVNPTPAAPTASSPMICNGTSTTLNATGPGGNYEWFDVASGGIALISSSTFTTPALTATTIYYVQTTFNGCPSPRTAVTVTVNAIPVPPTVSGATICSGSSTTLTASAPDGIFQWYSAPTGGTLLGTGPTYNTPTLTGSTNYYVQTNVNGCISTRTAVNVVVNPIPAAPTAAGMTICSGNATTLTATAPGGNYEWYSVPSGGSPLSSDDTYTTPALMATTTYYVQTTVNGCTSPRTAVTVTVKPTPLAPTAINPTICSGTSTTLMATAPGGSYKWYDDPVAGNLLASNANYTTAILTTTTTYYVETTVNGCTSARTAVTVTVNPLPAAPTALGATICSGNAITLTATAPGGSYRWYTTAGELLVSTASYTTPVLTATTTYRVEAISAEGCSGPYTNVTVTVIPEEDATFHYSSGTFCKTGTNPTPTVANPAGGTFTSAPAGLTIDANTGRIDLSASAVGTYTITFSTNTTCVYTSSSEITVTEAPNATFSYNSPFCQNQAGEVLPDFPSGASAGIFSSTPGLVFLNNTTGEIDLQSSIPGTYLITNFIAALGGCAEATDTYTITINPTPTVTSSASATICNKTPKSYNIESNLTGTTFTWSRATVPGISNLAVSNQTGDNITETLENTTAAPIEVAYEITPSLNGCNGPMFTYTLTVNPNPTVTSPSTATICNNTPQNYVITGNVNGSTYTWSRAVVLGISNPAVSPQTGDNITETLVNTTTAPINVVYEIIPLFDGCNGPMFTYTVTVNPTAVINSPSSANICSNTPQNYIITSDVAGTVFTWSRAAVTGINTPAAVAQSGNSITETLVNSTTAPIAVEYKIFPLFGGCDGPMFTYTLTVNPTPTVTSPTSATICNKIAQNYALTSDVSNTTFKWSRAAVTGISNLPALLQSGSSITETLENTTSAPIVVAYEITPSANGCDGPAFTYTVTVNPTPSVTSAANTIICDNTPQNYTITGNVSGSTFTWSRATVPGISNIAVSNQTGPISEALNNTTNAPVNVEYTIYSLAYGCEGPVFTYTVSVKPTPTVTSPAVADICNNTAQNYTITSDVSGATFIWSRAAVVGIDNPTTTPQSGSSITETLVNSTSAPIVVAYEIIPSLDGCNGPMFTYTLTVNPTPTVTSPPAATICNNTAQNYLITGNVSGSTFTWSRATIPGISNLPVSNQAGDNITETLVNTTHAPIAVIYEITPSANGCNGPVFTYTVTVNPTAEITSAAAADICNNTAQNYIITSDVAGSVFTWSRAAVTGINNAAIVAQSDNSITETLVNNTSAPIAVEYKISPSFGGCDGPMFTYTLTVNPTPTVTSTSNATLCNNIIQNYIITSDVSNTTFKWSRAEVAGISNLAVAAQNDNTIRETLINTTLAPINVVYEIVPLANGCTGPTFNYIVKVNPTPKVTSTANTIICNNTPQNYIMTGDVSATTFTWSRATVPGINNTAVNAQNSNTITESLVNTTSTPIVVTYEIIPSAYGCDGPIFTYAVTVNPTPTVTSPAVADICNNTAQNYTITSDVSGATFIWSRAAVVGIDNPATTPQSGSSITETLVNSTSAPIVVAYEIIPSLDGCNGPMFTYTLTVNPTPTVTSPPAATICNNTAQNYLITGNVSGNTFTWSRATIPGISNLPVSNQAGDNITETLVNTTHAPIAVIYEITPSANGCNGPVFTYTVTVNPTAEITSAAAADICNNTAQSYIITSDVVGAIFTWSRAAVTGINNAAIVAQSGNSITETLVNNTSAPIAVEYKISPSFGGCDGPMFTYTLTVNPTPTVTSTSNATLCNNIIQNYIITSDVSNTTFKWSRAEVAGISNPPALLQSGSSITETLENTTSAPIVVKYEITPFANGCDGPVFTYTVTVNPTPRVTSAATAIICNNTPQNYTMTGDVSGTTFTWSRTAVSGISNTAVNAQNSNTITESLTNTTSAPIAVTYEIMPSANSCSGPTFIYIVTVNPTPTVTSLAVADICNNTAQNYTITSDVSGTTFTWSRPSVPGINNPMIAAQLGNSITETLVNTTNLPIDVIYNIIPSINGCSGPVFAYTLKVNPTPAITSILNATICNNTPQNYTITSNVANATFTWSRATVAGISNLAVSNQTGSTITEALVNTTLAPISVVYKITPSAYGCTGETFTYTLIVYPTSAITSPGTGTICNNTPQNYLITSNISGTTYTWSRAAVSGISNAAVIAQNGNVITESLVNTTNLPIVVSYAISPAVNGCSGPIFTYNLTVNPTSRVINTPLSQTVCSSSGSTAVLLQSNVTGTTFTWTATASAGVTGFLTSGTGDIPAQILYNSSSGNGTITYTIQPSFAGCSGISVNYVITVLNQVPVTPIVANNSPICVGNALTLSAQNVNGATYSWTGPNGFTSNLQNPVINNVTLSNEGIYSVRITVGQCSSSANTSVIVNRPAIVTSNSDQIVCANNAVISLSGTVSGGSTTGVWTTSGSGIFPSGADVLNGTYVPSAADKAAGDVVLTLTATNTASCLPAKSSFHLTITPSPIVSAGGDRVICRYDHLVLRGQSNSAAIIWTSTGTGTFQPNNTSLNATYVPSNNDKITGNVSITLSTAGSSNCIPVSDKINVTITPPPTVELGPEIYVFQGESKVLNPLEVTGDNLQYLWMPNRGLNDNTLKNPLFTATNDIKYTLTVTGTSGCIAVDQLLIKVLKPIQIPNAFSPNGDGINDTWSLKEIDNYRGATIRIFNRYGTKILETGARDLSWDGTFKGNPLPVGVYYYILDLKEYGKARSGAITIMR